MMTMLKDIIHVACVGGSRILVRFEDGVEGVVDVSALIPFSGVFSGLVSHEVFMRVRVNPDTGTVEWAGGGDLDPDVLYSIITGTALPV